MTKVLNHSYFEGFFQNIHNFLIYKYFFGKKNLKIYANSQDPRLGSFTDLQKWVSIAVELSNLDGVFRKH